MQLSDLNQFTGTEHIYRHPLVRSIVYTDGVKYIAENAGAYWLIDLIASWQLEPKVAKQDFQVWKLKVSGNTAKAVCENGNGKVIASQDIEYTDFPFDGLSLYFTDHTILLPSEY